MKISGATIIKNGVKLGFPFIESIKSILPICDEVVVAVGDSEDSTRDKIEELGTNKIKIIDTVWDKSVRGGGLVLSEQTNIALSHCKNEFIFYIQSDEVINDSDYKRILADIESIKDNRRIAGLAFRYLHFYGNYNTVQSGRNWYSAEVRIFKNNVGITSHGDAQGFRHNGKKPRVLLTDSIIYHYGWARPPEIMLNKIKSFHSLWHDGIALEKKTSSSELSDYYSDLGNLIEYRGTHPKVMDEIISKHINSNFISDLRTKYLKSRTIAQAIADASRRFKFGEHFNFVKA